MPRVSNSPHRGNSLISPACLTVLTGHREMFQSVKWLPWESAQLGKKKPSCQRNAPCTKAWIHTRDQVHSIDVIMQMCVFQVSAFCKSLWKTTKLSISISKLLHKLQTASLSVAWVLHQRLLSLSEELLILIWPPLPPMTESTWYTHDSDMPTWNPKSFTKCNFIEANCLLLWAGSAMFPPVNPQCQWSFELLQWVSERETSLAKIMGGKKDFCAPARVSVAVSIFTSLGN